MTPEGIAQLKADEGLSLTAYPDPLSPLGKAWAAEKRKPNGRGKTLLQLRQGGGLSGAPWTIGYGCTGTDASGNAIVAATVWTRDTADVELLRRVAEFEACLRRHWPWVAGLNEARQDVLANMIFNLGPDKLAGFHNTLASIEAGAYADAADGMLKSLWAGQVGARAQRLAERMRAGA